MIARLPFVGRAAELAHVLRALTDGRGVALVGAPGVGKTRIAVEAVDQLRRAGHQVIDCYATAAASVVPFGALAALLPADLRTANPLRHAVELIPPDTVIAVDDAHLLDQPSVALLQHLLRHTNTKLLLTARTIPWTDGGLDRLVVGNLTREATDELVRAALGDDADGAVLFHRSQGNPLYLAELIKAGDAEVSPELAEIVWANLGRLEGQLRHALELLAYGEPLRMDVFAQLAGTELVDELEERGLVTLRASLARLGHPLYGELLRRTCPTLRSRRHCQQLAEAVHDAPFRVAVWRLTSDSPLTVEEMIAAAEEWLACRDVESVQPADRGGVLRAAMVLAQALVHSRMLEKADLLLRRVIENTRPPDAAQLAVVRANCLFYGLGRDDEARGVLDAVERLGLSPGVRFFIEVTRLTFTMHSSSVADARHELAALEARSDAPPWARTVSDYLTARCDMHAGRYADAREALTRIDDRATQVQYPIAAALADWHFRLRGWTLLSGGAIDDAEAYAARFRSDEADDIRALLEDVSIGTLLSRCAQLRGNAREAVRQALTATAYVREQLVLADVRAVTELARAAALHGQVDEASAALDRAESALRPAWRLEGCQVAQARSWVLASSGALAEAAEAAVDAAARAAALGLHGFEAESLHDAARFGADVSDRLGVLSRELGDPMTFAYALHALGRARGDSTLLDSAAARFGSIGATLFAAEALAERVRLHGGGVAGHRLATLAATFDGVELDTVRTGPAGRLTARQLQVARLAVTGLTNAQIAERMTISKRTVDNHLHAAYTALGVAGRTELAAALGTGGAPN